MIGGRQDAYVSWVILPIAPTGVVSVSPVARAATIERTNEEHRDVPSLADLEVIAPSTTKPTVENTIPAERRTLGTSILSLVRTLSRVSLTACGASFWKKLADAAEGAHDSAPLEREREQSDVTISAAPGHRRTAIAR